MLDDWHTDTPCLIDAYHVICEDEAEAPENIQSRHARGRHGKTQERKGTINKLHRRGMEKAIHRF